MQGRLRALNGSISEDGFYGISSRIGAYDIAAKSATFLVFMILYICVLLYAAAILMIHFKLGMEHDDERRKLHSLHRIGITDAESSAITSRKIMAICLIPSLFSVTLAFLYGYFVNYTYGYGQIGVAYSTLCSLILVSIHLPYGGCTRSGPSEK